MKKRQKHRPHNPAAYLRRAIHNLRVDEMRHDQTRQREFERRFESRDLPDSRAARADASDNSRAINRLVRQMDEPVRQKLREMRVNQAAASLPRTSAWLRPLLWAIYRNGSNRKKTMSELGLSKSSYWWGVNFFLKFFSARI